MCNCKRKWMLDISVFVCSSSSVVVWAQLQNVPVSSLWKWNKRALPEFVRTANNHSLCVCACVLSSTFKTDLNCGERSQTTQPLLTRREGRERRSETRERKVSIGPRDLGGLLKAYRQWDEGTNRPAFLAGWSKQEDEKVSPLSPQTYFRYKKIEAYCVPTKTQWKKKITTLRILQTRNCFFFFKVTSLKGTQCST